jgi:hypothetical protein
MRRTSRLVYKTNPKFPTIEVIATAIAVDNIQGFVRSGQGYTKVNDDGSEEVIKDNKTIILHSLLNKEGEGIKPTTSDREAAVHLVDDVTGRLTMKKLGGNLNEFETALMENVTAETVGVYGVALIASIPNTQKHQAKRDTVKDKLDNLISSSEVVGKMGTRCMFTLDIIDITYVKKMGIFMVTGLENNKNVVKFWFSSDPDISGILEGKTITLAGFVKSQGKSKYSNCQETIINRVKVSDVSS